MFKKLIGLLALVVPLLFAQTSVFAIEADLFVQPTGQVPTPLLLDPSNYPYINCTNCSATAGTFNNNADSIATSADNGKVATWNYLFNGTTFDRVRDAKGAYGGGSQFPANQKGIQAVLITGLDNATGTKPTVPNLITGSTDALDFSPINSFQNSSLLYLYNGATFDRWRGDTTSGAWVNCKTGCGSTQVAATTTQTGPTVAVGLTFQSVAASSGSRKGCTIQNPPTATEVLYVFFGATGSATTSNSFTLSPGQALSCVSGPVVLTDNIAVTSTTAAHAFILAVQ